MQGIPVGEEQQQHEFHNSPNPNLNSNSNNLNFNMDTLFREFSELMDDANDKMPEGIYLALYNKLKELKDQVSDVGGAAERVFLERATGVPDGIVREIILHERQHYLAIIAECRQAKEVSDNKIKELEEAVLRSRPRCRCGSTDHLKTNFLGCRLNKRVLAGDYGTVARDRALAETAALADPPTEV